MAVCGMGGGRCRPCTWTWGPGLCPECGAAAGVQVGQEDDPEAVSWVEASVLGQKVGERLGGVVTGCHGLCGKQQKGTGLGKKGTLSEEG